MTKRLLVATTLFLMIGLFAYRAERISAVSGDCATSATGSIPVLTSLDFSFTCSDATTVYAGVCDSGGVPNDDLFSIEAGGALLSYNYYVDRVFEYTVLGEVVAAAGDNTMTLVSLNDTPTPPATYSYAVSPDAGEVVDYLRAWCGVDWQGIGPGIGAACDTTVNLFTTDVAPSDGTLEFHVLFGNEGSRADEIRFMSWSVSAGEQINNAPVLGLPAPRFARVWWQPEGSTDWYMLTSQYWHGGGATTDEYGISCGNGQPSYHTSFASAVPESEVCFDLQNGCK